MPLAPLAPLAHNRDQAEIGGAAAGDAYRVDAEIAEIAAAPGDKEQLHHFDNHTERQHPQGYRQHSGGTMPRVVEVRMEQRRGQIAERHDVG